MQAGSPRQAGIEREERCTGLGSRLIGQGEKLLFGLEIVVAERNIGRCGRGWFYGRLLGRILRASRNSQGRSHHSGRRRNRDGARYQQKRDGESSTGPAN